MDLKEYENLKEKYKIAINSRSMPHSISERNLPKMTTAMPIVSNNKNLEYNLDLDPAALFTGKSQLMSLTPSKSAR